MFKLLDIEKKIAVRARLARVEGQMRGVLRLIDEDADCVRSKPIERFQRHNTQELTIQVIPGATLSSYI